MEKAVTHILQSLANKRYENRKYRVMFKKDFIEKLFHSMAILDLPATTQLGKMWRRLSTAPVLKQDLQKPVRIR